MPPAPLSVTLVIRTDNRPGPLRSTSTPGPNVSLARNTGVAASQSADVAGKPVRWSLPLQTPWSAALP
ncbi:hypothetical protein [Roseomonas sp. USHLN139]|uniref:hypothetical protein n=1 Tax=Roseomonas sp. USHLN139 TaxID=3081298 RepID=UPI003B025E0C